MVMLLMMTRYKYGDFRFRLVVRSPASLSFRLHICVWRVTATLASTERSTLKVLEEIPRLDDMPFDLPRDLCLFVCLFVRGLYDGETSALAFRERSS